MLNMQDIRELIKIVDESGIAKFSYETEGMKVSIQKNQAETVQHGASAVSLPTAVHDMPGQAAQQAPTGAQLSAQAAESGQAAHLHTIESPMVGTFYRAPAPEADPFVKEGDHVSEHTVVCIVEAMKLMNEIEAEVKGEIVQVFVENGQLVEYGQPLFLVKPE